MNRRELFKGILGVVVAAKALPAQAAPAADASRFLLDVDGDAIQYFQPWAGSVEISVDEWEERLVCRVSGSTPPAPDQIVSVGISSFQFTGRVVAIEWTINDPRTFEMTVVRRQPPEVTRRMLEIRHANP